MQLKMRASKSGGRKRSLIRRTTSLTDRRNKKRDQFYNGTFITLFMCFEKKI